MSTASARRSAPSSSMTSRPALQRRSEIASITKIHLHSLELLEESRWDALPPEPFLRYPFGQDQDWPGRRGVSQALLSRLETVPKA